MNTWTCLWWSLYGTSASQNQTEVTERHAVYLLKHLIGSYVTYYTVRWRICLFRTITRHLQSLLSLGHAGQNLRRVYLLLCGTVLPCTCNSNIPSTRITLLLLTGKRCLLSDEFDKFHLMWSYLVIAMLLCWRIRIYLCCPIINNRSIIQMRWYHTACVPVTVKHQGNSLVFLVDVVKILTEVSAGFVRRWKSEQFLLMSMADFHRSKGRSSDN